MRYTGEVIKVNEVPLLLVPLLLDTAIIRRLHCGYQVYKTINLEGRRSRRAKHYHLLHHNYKCYKRNEIFFSTKDVSILYLCSKEINSVFSVCDLSQFAYFDWISANRFL